MNTPTMLRTLFFTLALCTLTPAHAMLRNASKLTPRTTQQSLTRFMCSQSHNNQGGSKNNGFNPDKDFEHLNNYDLAKFSGGVLVALSLGSGIKDHLKSESTSYKFVNTYTTGCDIAGIILGVKYVLSKPMPKNPYLATAKITLVPAAGGILGMTSGTLLILGVASALGSNH